jgi:hypothetical protein
VSLRQTFDQYVADWGSQEGSDAGGFHSGSALMRNDFGQVAMEYVAERAMFVTAAFAQCIQRFLSLNLVLPLAGVGVNYTHPLLGIVPYIEIRDLRWHACPSD